VQSADTADQILYGMEHYITNEGVRRSLVEADTAYVYETSQLADLRRLKVTFFDKGGVQTSIVTADSGTYLMRGGGMKARGHVVAITPDGGRLTSEHLDYDEKTNSISSDMAFVFDRTGQHIEGNAFTSDPDFRNIVTKQPRGSERGAPGSHKAGDSGGILLPGQ
jgi:LPS export ABC transporter protein LptC